ncbi:MAG: alanine--tRNA ligase [Phycisphaeraceae bacterium]|nr:alanine--tRNA ligase [Phycisphaeraceae bacterium]
MSISSNEVRRQFIDYFAQKHAHEFVPSSPVVPHEDPTLLFANAGMNQFKDIFLGVDVERGRRLRRAVNTQKCIRAGGKHNDLDDVGRDTYHHTFFEMLGNWSFGDYFKREAVEWAWDLLTDVWGLEKSRMHATVFEGAPGQGIERDEEAARLWRDHTDIDPSHIHYGEMADNFWEMGETGPCGPCSEIHYDQTPDRSGAGLVNAGDPRVIEIWNLVFIQYNRGVDGKLDALPARHVDTGMGFERICSILGGKTSNYDTDVFGPLFTAIADITSARPYDGSSKGGGDPIDVAYRVIADHIRCLTFALTDGAAPGNEGRGYVLRRILRRAVRHGWQTFEMNEPFLWRLVPAVVDAMSGAFPELTGAGDRVAEIVRDEEKAFDRTLGRGLALFDEAADRGGRRISGEDAFRLHDTFGFPLDLTEVMAEERGLEVDVDGFNARMEQAREIARAGGGGSRIEPALVELVQKGGLEPTSFEGYVRTEISYSGTCSLYRIEDDRPVAVDAASDGEAVAIAVSRSPFYCEAGGQVADTGAIVTDSGEVRVDRAIRVGDIVFHVGVVTSGTCRAAGDGAAISLTLRVEEARRRKIMANHTATHMLNRALRRHVDAEADQKGSLVDDEKTRFDFAHGSAMTAEEVEAVERSVNHDVAADMPVYFDEVPQEQAMKINGLRAVFGERYPPVVRVVCIGVPVADLMAEPGNDAWRDYSIEFCGGTHLAKTGDAEGFVIESEEAVAKGVRRVTALTGRVAHQAEAEGQRLVGRLEALRGADPEQLEEALAPFIRETESVTLPLRIRTALRESVQKLQAQVKGHRKKTSRVAADQVVDQARQIADSAQDGVIVASIDGADAATLRTAMDVIRKKRPDDAMLLAAASDEKVAFLAAVPKGLIEKGLKAGDWVREAAKMAGGGGGGRPDMAQAGGRDPSKTDAALEAARQFAAGKLGG